MEPAGNAEFDAAALTVTGAVWSSPVTTSAPVPLISVNDPGCVVTTANWAWAVAVTSKPAAPTKARANFLCSFIFLPLLADVAAIPHAGDTPSGSAIRQVTPDAPGHDLTS